MALDWTQQIDNPYPAGPLWLAGFGLLTVWEWPGCEPSHKACNRLDPSGERAVRQLALSSFGNLLPVTVRGCSGGAWLGVGTEAH